jgi:hypothetical protein
MTHFIGEHLLNKITAGTFAPSSRTELATQSGQL